jgi:hypothetical protein
MTISKSLYTLGIQCPKSLWLKKHKFSVLTPPDASADAIFETGNIVGALACALSDSEEVLLGCELFPAGKKVEFSREHDEMLSTTRQHIENGVPNIYEATFSYDGILVMVDILSVDADGVSIYEVKSWVGDELDISELFSVVDVSQEVQSLQANIPHVLEEFENYLIDKTNEPDIDIGKQCKRPHDTVPAKALCNS